MATVKGGYDCDFVHDPPKSLECTICLLTLRDPHVISCCGNHFCRPCIERVQRDKKSCPLCNDPEFTVLLHKGVMRDVNALLVRCPQKALGCAWEGELGQLQRHLEPGAGLLGSGCAYVEVGCANGCGGRFLRGEVRAHELEVCPRRPLEVVMASILKRLDALTAENQAMKAENQQLKQEVVQLRQDLATKAEVSQLNEATTKELKLCAKTADVDSKFRNVDVKCSSLEKQVTLTMPCYLKMYNYEVFKSVNYMWHSEPFFTHLGGYKMRVQVYSGGLGRGKGTHLSLFVQIMRGGNDDQLQWPFQGSVTVKAYNWQTEAWDRSYTIEFNESSPTECCKKPLPQDVANFSYGHQWYFTNNEVECYKKKDAIKFYVTMPA